MKRSVRITYNQLENNHIEAWYEDGELMFVDIRTPGTEGESLLPLNKEDVVRLNLILNDILDVAEIK